MLTLTKKHGSGGETVTIHAAVNGQVGERLSGVRSVMLLRIVMRVQGCGRACCPQ